MEPARQAVGFGFWAFQLRTVARVERCGAELPAGRGSNFTLQRKRHAPGHLQPSHRLPDEPATR